MRAQKNFMQQQTEADDQQQHRKDEQESDQGIQFQMLRVIDEERYDDRKYDDHAAGGNTEGAMNGSCPAAQHTQLMYQDSVQVVTN